MAYINFDDFASRPGSSLASQPATDHSRLSTLEWSVVAIAQHDPLSSINIPGRLSVALGSLFGQRHNPRLADMRLEALRRIAVLAWHRSYALPVSEIKAFLAAGFTMDNFETLLASISRGRSARKRKN